MDKIPGHDDHFEPRQSKIQSAFESYADNLTTEEYEELSINFLEDEGYHHVYESDEFQEWLFRYFQKAIYA